jgi:uncharacterized membrane protein
VTTPVGKSWRAVRALLALAPPVALAALARFKPPDGLEHARLAQFVGRFHPAVVHFPVALLALLLVVEVAGATRRWARVREAAGFIMLLAVLSTFVAAWMGWLLAWSGSYRGPVVSLHLWGGVWLCFATLACAALRGRDPARPGAPYALALVASVGLMVWTGHLGGQLSHGDSFLSEYMPARARAWVGLPPVRPAPPRPAAGAPAGPRSFYVASVAPILEDHCVVCHDANKQKGKLRLDSYAWILRGGEDGPVLKPGDAKGSELYRRITLPADDDDFMPSDGKPPLKPAEVMLIRHWIETGAPPDTADTYAPVGATAPAAPPAAPDYRPFLAELAALEARLGVRLTPRSRNPTDGLILRTVSAPERCDDAALASLRPVASLIVEAELARTRVTDAGLAALAGFSNLRSLDLSHTAVTSANLGALISLPRLEKLNLTATAIDAAGLARLRAAHRIKHLYYFQTRAFTETR